MSPLLFSSWAAFALPDYCGSFRLQINLDTFIDSEESQRRAMYDVYHLTDILVVVDWGFIWRKSI